MVKSVAFLIFTANNSERSWFATACEGITTGMRALHIKRVKQTLSSYRTLLDDIMQFQGLLNSRYSIGFSMSFLNINRSRILSEYVEFSWLLSIDSLTSGTSNE